MGMKDEKTTDNFLDHDNVMEWFGRYFQGFSQCDSIRLTYMTQFAERYFPLPRHFRLLDYGCGIGDFFPVWSHFKYDVVGVEPCLEAVKRAKENPFGYPVIQNDGQTVPFPDGHFDVIACDSVLPHVSDDLLPVLEGEFWRVLKDGGSLFMKAEIARTKEDVGFFKIRGGEIVPEKHRLMKTYLELFKHWRRVDKQDRGFRGWFMFRKESP